MNTSTPDIKNRGWTVTLAALGINLILGVLYAWSPIAKALQKQFNWTATERNLPFAISTAIFAISMIFAGRVQDRIGPKRVAVLGGFILGAGLLLSGFTANPYVMLVTFGIIGGAGIGLGYSATTPPAVKWFPPAKKGLITGIVVAGVGLAAVYMAPLTTWMMNTLGIRNTFILLGIGSIIVVTICAQFLVNPPAGYKPASSAPAASSAAKPLPISRPELDWNEMLATPQFYMLWIMYVLAAAPGLMLIANIANIAAEQAQMKDIFWPVMMLAIFNTVGRVSSGYVSDAIGRTRTMMLAFLLQSLNMYLFAKYNTPQLIMFGAAFTGLCYGTIFTLMPAASADFYGLKNLGVNYGILFTGFGVAGVVGSLLGGKVRDVFQNYNNAYLAVSIMLVASALIAILTRAPRRETVVQEPKPELVGAGK